MMCEKPTSFPPTVMLTSVVEERSAETWPAATLAVVAPSRPPT
jgi:hypothetical protein